MAAAIMGLFSALPEMLKLVKEFMTWVNHVSGNDPQGFIKTVGEAISQLNNAKNEQERKDAAQRIAEAINKLP